MPGFLKGLTHRLLEGTLDLHVQRGFLISFPLLILLLNSSRFLNPGGIDNWLYMGFFCNYPEFISNLFPETYYGTRLSWILPGYVVHHVFPPLIATYLLHLGVFYLAVFSLYGTVFRLLGPRVAFLSAILMGGYSDFVYSVGWDYVDGIGTAYYLLTIYLLTRAALAERPQTWLLAAGAAAAAMVHSNVALASCCISLPFYFIILRIGRFPLGIGKSFVLCALLGTLGAILLTLALCAVNYLSGGLFWFFWPSVKWALSFDFGNNPWTVPPGIWILKASWMVIPIVAMVASLILVLRTARKAFPGGALPELALAVNLLIVGLLNLSLRPDVFSVSFLSSFFIGPSFLVLAVLLRGTDHLSPPRYGLLALGAWTFLVVDASCGLYMASRVPWSLIPELTSHQSMALLLGYVLGLAAVLAVLSLYQGTVSSTVAAVLLCLTVIILPRWDKEPRMPLVSRVAEAMEVTRSAAGHRLPRFWYDISERLGYEYLALSSSYLFQYSVLNERFPDAMPDFHRPLSNNSLLVVLSQREDVFGEAQQALASSGFSLSFIKSVRIGDMKDGYFMVFAQVRKELLHLPELASLPLSLLEKAHGSMVGTGPIQITASAQQWAYAATLRLPERFGSDFQSSPGFVQVSLEVEEGRIGLGLVEKDFTTIVGTEVESRVENKKVIVQLPFENYLQCAFMFVRNTSNKGPSRALIHSISLHRAE